MSTTRRRRFALILLVIIAACGCLALGWWQWSRFESTSGTFQNLGYALQWPMFAGFCVYAYRKFIRYEEDGAPEPPSDADSITEIPAGLLPERPTARATSDETDPPQCATTTPTSPSWPRPIRPPEDQNRTTA